MASLGEVGDGLNRVLNKAAEAGAALQTAAGLAEDAQQLLSSAAEGSLQADVEEANARFDEVVRGTQTLHQFLGAGISGVEAMLSRLELDTGAPTSTAPPRAAAPPPESTRAPAELGSREHIEQLRRDLPPPVQPRSGQKTHGRWFASIDDRDASVQKLASGEDEWYAAAKQHLAEMGAPGTPVTAVDVEIKLAVHMARNNIRHATLTLNNTPCKGRFGCDALVPVLLPEGCTLTIHGVTPGGRIMRKTYTGGAPAPWS